MRNSYWWANKIRSWNMEWKTGIFPLEMASFLSLCDSHKIKTIIESGRGTDAYSTQILGKYAEITGAKVVSIDLNPPQENLRRYPIKFLTGNSFHILPDAFKKQPSPFAFLVDGPKGKEALRLSCAASYIWGIKVLAHHNVDSPQMFKTIFPGSFYYEDKGMGDLWSLKQWEKETVKKGIYTGRSLNWGESSLIMTPYADYARFRFSWLWIKWILKNNFFNRRKK